MAANASEKIIAILAGLAVFWTAIAFVLPFAVPIDESLPGPDAAGAQQALFFGPLFLVVLTAAAMTVLTAILFRYLRRRYRVLGFSPLLLVVLGFLLMETAALW